MILAEVSISSRLITLSVVGLVLILLSVLSLVNKDSSFTPARQSKTFHFGFWDILLVAGLFMVLYPILNLFPHDGDVTIRNRYGHPYHGLCYLALLFAFICHTGIMILLKKIRQNWAMNDLEERRKKSGNKAHRRSRQKMRKHAK
ncbi:MAG: hypothetical protein UHH87_04055 [Akkermansia sp.]|nr:hypothetical protein [Akkermansia sp.]